MSELIHIFHCLVSLVIVVIVIALRSCQNKTACLSRYLPWKLPCFPTNRRRGGNILSALTTNAGTQPGVRERKWEISPSPFPHPAANQPLLCCRVTYSVKLYQGMAFHPLKEGIQVLFATKYFESADSSRYFFMKRQRGAYLVCGNASMYRNNNGHR